ncbi:hypothetical protein EVC45_44610 [Paraburkholderia sp. UYCP14C]|uniref:hypothetical protein n=1 Tax=Paraburkholderia sp. UYCP14C TaxID=2511130 RepID=UPI00101FC93B|nr:hypothetical protein [Paraburkholderia sp. UYCP14C]RZF23432.1 hypothetical protein EVC45_44610 [Paraburkholderia sp. UYCP14C]
MTDEVQDIDQARRIARRFASEEGVNEARAEAYADVWYEAGKDDDASTETALRAHLRRRFAGSH